MPAGLLHPELLTLLAIRDQRVTTSARECLHLLSNELSTTFSNNYAHHQTGRTLDGSIQYRRHIYVCFETKRGVPRFQRSAMGSA